MGRYETPQCYRPYTLAEVHMILNGRNPEVIDADAEPEVIKRAGKNPSSHSSSAV